MATTIPEWVPKFIRQVVAYREKQKVTHERLNELFNLLITQGDWNTETIQTLLNNLEEFDTQYIADLQANATAHANILANFNSTIATIRTETNTAISNLDAQQRALMATLLTQFQEDLAEVEASVNAAMAQKLSEIQLLVNTATEQYNTSATRMGELEATIEALRDSILADNQAIADQMAADRDYIEQALVAAGSTIADAAAIYQALADKADKSEIPTELPALGGDADTVNGHTVNADVPANAKFTDTIFQLPATLPPSIIAQNSTNRFMTDAERTKLGGIAAGATAYTHPANHPASILSSGTLASGVLATNSTDYTTSRLRNIRFGTTVPTTLANGELYFMYE